MVGYSSLICGLPVIRPELEFSFGECLGDLASTQLDEQGEATFARCPHAEQRCPNPNLPECIPKPAQVLANNSPRTNDHRVLTRPSARLDNFTCCEVRSRGAHRYAQASAPGCEKISRCGERNRCVGSDRQRGSVAEFSRDSRHVQGRRQREGICDFQYSAESLQTCHSHPLCENDQGKANARTRLHPVFLDAQGIR